MDESSDIRSQYTEDGNSLFSGPRAGPIQPPNSGLCESVDEQNGTPTTLTSLTEPSDGFTVLSLLNSESPVQLQSSSASISQRHPLSTEPFQHNGGSTFVHQQPPGAPILWPLEHEQEAMLLQHYIENVALFVGVA